MARPQHYFDWQSIVDEQVEEPFETTRHRLRWVLGFFGVAAAVVMIRAVQLEVSDGENFRQLAARPLEREVTLPAPRGRILARDGTVLAGDRHARALGIQFRYLENPPNPAWLRHMARARLPRADRRQREKVAAAEETLCQELAAMHDRLAELCQISEEQWRIRTTRIQRRVGAVAASVNTRRRAAFEQQLAAEPTDQELSVNVVLAGLFAPPERLPPPEVIVAEQTEFHIIVDDVPPEVITEIEQNPKKWPGVKIVDHVRRDYPVGSLAANLLGHVGKNSLGDSVGRMGVEARFDSQLTGRAGHEVHVTDHRGKLLSTRRQSDPVAGQDVVLSIHSGLQRSAEQCLDRATRRRRGTAAAFDETALGGAIVVLDVHSGELLAAAGSPRFDPNVFAMGDEQVEGILHDPRQPLFDRAARMAIAPGSVFKPLTAVALLESQVVVPEAPFHCQGYLEEPDRLRCQIFRQHGIGHGDVTLIDALAQSCNVYFFHHAMELGATPLLDWASRFGFGQPTGLEGLDESTGHLPRADSLRETRQTQALAIGQGALTATPLQVARMYAAIANGGRLVTPRLVLSSPPQNAADIRDSADSAVAGAPIAGLTPAALAAVREGLLQVVNDPRGTAFSTARLAWPTVAGKTGTAETGGGQPDHAWFAGYAPAESPRYAVVVALEHGGSGAHAAGTIARQIVLCMQELGYFGPPPTAEKSIPPGKG